MFYFIGFLSTAAYWPGVTGNSINTVWVALAVSLPWMLPRTAATFGLNATITAAAALWLLVVGLAAPLGIETFLHYSIILFCVLLAIVANEHGAPKLFAGAVVGLAASLIVSLFYIFGVPLVDQAGGVRPAGLFGNPMFFGIVSGLLAVAAFQYLNWMWSIVPLAGVLLAGSRTGLGVLLVGALCWLWRRDRLLFWCALAFVALFSIPIIMYRPETLAERLLVWQAALEQLSWLGNGAGTAPDLVASVSRQNGLLFERRPLHAHSAAIQLVFEFGIFAMSVLAAMVYAVWKRGDALLLSSCFVVITFEAFSQPSIAFVCAIAFGLALRVDNVAGVAGAGCGPDTGQRVSHSRPGPDPDSGKIISV